VCVVCVFVCECGVCVWCGVCVCVRCGVCGVCVCEVCVLLCGVCEVVCGVVWCVCVCCVCVPVFINYCKQHKKLFQSELTKPTVPLLCSNPIVCGSDGV
jgi:hypothetical protein